VDHKWINLDHNFRLCQKLNWRRWLSRKMSQSLARLRVETVLLTKAFLGELLHRQRESAKSVRRLAALFS
jgi:hypothetical protein